MLKKEPQFYQFDIAKSFELLYLKGFQQMLKSVP